jgi:hypothetical protein
MAFKVTAWLLSLYFRVCGISQQTQPEALADSGTVHLATTLSSSRRYSPFVEDTHTTQLSFDFFTFCLKFLFCRELVGP